MFMSLFVIYGFDTAGTFGEETVDPGRQAPRGILAAILLSGAVGFVFLLAIILSFKDVPAEISSARPRTPDRRHDPGQHEDFGKIYLAVMLSPCSSARWRSRVRRPA